MPGIKMHQKLNFGVALLHCIPAPSDAGTGYSQHPTPDICNELISDVFRETENANPDIFEED